jgi:hypothetical protein
MRARPTIATATTLCLALTSASLSQAEPEPKTGAFVAGAPTGKTPERQLGEGRLAYERGDYAGAVRTLTPLLYPSIELTNVEGVIEAHRLLALSYLLQKKEQEAEEEASSILALRPNFELDPIVDPPMAVAFFDGVRKKQDARLRELRAREHREAEERAKEEERRRRANAERIYIERKVRVNSRLLATVPFGVGQWQNGQPRKAALFLSGELVFGALSLASYVALERKYPYDATKNSHIYPAGESQTALALTGLQLGAGIAFWATLVWGIIDAHVLYKPQRVESRELPKGVLKSMIVAPVMGTNQGGIAIQGAF